MRQVEFTNMKRLFLILIMCSIIFYRHESIAFSCDKRDFNLRPPIKFGILELFHRVNTEIFEKIKDYPFIAGLIARERKEDNCLFPPNVKFILSTDLNYKYDNDQNEIVFYVPENIAEEDFRKVCWLAYGEWLTIGTVRIWDKQAHNSKSWNNTVYLDTMRKRNYIDSQAVKDKVVLDVATGEGIPAILIAQHAKRVICLDASKAMLDKAKTKADSMRLSNIDFKQGSIFKLPFEDNFFDIVYANQIFELYPEELRRIALQEIMRVLKPEGKFKSIECYRVPIKWKKMGWDNNEWLSELTGIGFDKNNSSVEIISMQERIVIISFIYDITAVKPKGICVNGNITSRQQL